MDIADSKLTADSGSQLSASLSLDSVADSKDDAKPANGTMKVSIVDALPSGYEVASAYPEMMKPGSTASPFRPVLVCSSNSRAPCLALSMQEHIRIFEVTNQGLIPKQALHDGCKPVEIGTAALRGSP